MDKALKFSDYKDDIIKKLNERGNVLEICEPVILIDGFINQPIYGELTGNFVIGGPSITMIALVGENSGRIYFFAVKALLPNFGEINIKNGVKLKENKKGKISKKSNGEEIVKIFKLIKSIFCCKKNVILCPFHKEKTPSCIVDFKNETYRCLSCGKTGTIRELVSLGYEAQNKSNKNE